MTCSEFEDLILDEMDGRIAPEAAPLLRDHLAVCPECRAFCGAQIEIDRSMTVAVEKIAARDLAPPDVRIPRSEPTPSLGFVWDLAGVASVAAAAGFAVAYLLPHAMAGAPWAAAATVLCAGACLVTLAEPGQAEPPSPSA